MAVHEEILTQAYITVFKFTGTSLGTQELETKINIPFEFRLEKLFCRDTFITKVTQSCHSTLAIPAKDKIKIKFINHMRKSWIITESQHTQQR